MEPEIENSENKRQAVCDDVKEALSNAGIKSGDIIFVHSDVTPVIHSEGFGWLTDSLNFLKNCFLEILGPEGTLILPTFNYDFCKGKTYSHEKSPSQVGLFPNFVMKDHRAIRSFHPIYSCVAIGKDAKNLMNGVSKSSFGKDSLFHRLHIKNAKLIFFNVSFYYCTYIHYVEQHIGVDYRFLKTFEGKVIVNGKEYNDKFDFYARYLDQNIVLDLTRLESDLLSDGRMQKAFFRKKHQVLQVSCDNVYHEAIRKVNSDPYYLLKTPPLT